MKHQTKSMLATVGVTIASYAVMELLHHGVIAAHIAPWLMSLGMSAAMVSYLYWALVALGAAVVGWLVWKFFVSSDSE